MENRHIRRSKNRRQKGKVKMENPNKNEDFSARINSNIEGQKLPAILAGKIIGYCDFTEIHFNMKSKCLYTKYVQFSPNEIGIKFLSITLPEDGNSPVFDLDFEVFSGMAWTSVSRDPDFPGEERKQINILFSLNYESLMWPKFVLSLSHNETGELHTQTISAPNLDMAKSIDHKTSKVLDAWPLN